MARIRYLDALRIKQALNCAALDEADVALEPCRMLTTKELRELKALIDSLSLKPQECGHLTWDWPMACCPSCGTRDIGQDVGDGSP